MADLKLRGVGLGLGQLVHGKGRHAAALLALATAMGAGSVARGVVIASDDFESYTSNAAIGGTTGGTGFGSNAWVVGTTPPTVVSPSTPVSYSVMNANAQTVGTISGGTKALQFTNATNNNTAGTTVGTCVRDGQQRRRSLGSVFAPHRCRNG